MIAYIIVGIIAYLIGSISFSVIVSKLVGGFDVREKGSGNAGTTNVLRTLGKVPVLITLIGDILKGVIDTSPFAGEYKKISNDTPDALNTTF